MKATCLVCDKDFKVDNADVPLSYIDSGDVNSVCPSCLADARLGRLVRGMPEWSDLQRRGKYWHADVDEEETASNCDTPEAALEAAGVKEGEG